jgi:hypothetical protein
VLGLLALAILSLHATLSQNGIRVTNIAKLILNVLDNGDATPCPWLGNPFRILRDSAIIPIPDLFNSGIFIGI